MTTKLPFALLQSFESAEQTITGTSNTTIAHGLGAVPKDVQLYLRCKTAQLGFSVGDEIPISYSTTCNAQITANATNLIISILTATLGIIDRSVPQIGTITTANWRLVARAFL